MSEYFYTYKNEYDVVDVGCIEAVSVKDYRRKLKDIGIKPRSVYISQDAYIGLEFLFTNQTKFKYRYLDANNKTVMLTKTKDWRFYISLGSIFIMAISLPLSYGLTSKITLYFLSCLSLYLIALFLDFYCYYELEMDRASGIIKKRKKIAKFQIWEKEINASNAIIHLAQKIARYRRYFEKLYITEIKIPDKAIAISCSCQEDSEFKLAKAISETLSLPFSSYKDIKDV